MPFDELCNLRIVAGSSGSILVTGSGSQWNSSGGVHVGEPNAQLMFAAGDFTAPMLFPAQTPPGVTAIKLLKEEITYRFEETERGGRVRITTTNSEALAAIYEFLRFQIRDHGTSDSGVVERR